MRENRAVKSGERGRVRKRKRKRKRKNYHRGRRDRNGEDTEEDIVGFVGGIWRKWPPEGARYRVW
jgi:hypothetical protein